MSTAIKFTLDSGDVTFTDQEMCEVREIPEQTIIAHKSQQTASTVQVYDNQFMMWQVTIQDVDDTLTRIMQIVNEKNEMTFYPYYQYNPSTSYKVILVPDEVKKVYAYGGRQALLYTTFNLLESSK